MDPDRELLERFLNGDERAFEDLVTRYEARIRNLAFGFVRDRALAEDIAQESFLRAYRKASSLRREQSFRAWLYRIAINCAQDELRRRSRKAEVPLVESEDRRSSTATVAETALAVGRVADALAELKPEYRAPLVLREVEGLTYREIADTLGWPLGTVQARVHRGRQELRRRLEGNDGK